MNRLPCPPDALVKGLGLAVTVGWVALLVTTGVVCLPPMAMVCIALLALDIGDKGAAGGAVVAAGCDAGLLSITQLFPSPPFLSDTSLPHP